MLAGSTPVRVAAALLAARWSPRLALYPVPVWLVVAALLLTAFGAGLRWLALDDVRPWRSRPLPRRPASRSPLTPTC